MKNLTTAEEAIHWFSRWREGDSPEDDRKAFLSWLNESPVHVREYLEMAKVWGGLQSPGAWPSVSREEMLQIVRETARGARVKLVTTEEEIDESLPQGIGQATRAGRVWRWFVPSVLAAGVLAFAIGAWLYLGAKPIYSTARGEQRYVVLPDGSDVRLNTLTKMVIRFDERSRRIELAQGEALFHVAYDPRRPFEVRTPYARVRALGTEFNVYNRPEGTTVTVVEGKVRVASAVPAAAQVPAPFIDLAPQQVAEATVRGAVTPLKRRGTLKPDPQGEIPWVKRRIVLDGDTVGAAVTEFNRYNLQQIRIEDSTLRDLRITGVFNADEPVALVKYLEEIRPVRVTETRAQLILRP